MIKDWWSNIVNKQVKTSIILILTGVGILLLQLLDGGFTLTDFFGIHHESMGLLIILIGVVIGIVRERKP